MSLPYPIAANPDPKGASLFIRLSLKPKQQEKLLERLHQAYAGGQLRLVKRIHTLLYATEGKSAADIAEILGLSEQCTRTYLTTFILKGLDSLVDRRPPGRPARRTKTQKRELGQWIDTGPEAMGYDQGCWTSALIQDLILTRFGVEYSPPYLAEFLKNMGYSYQKARFASDPLDDVSEEQREWLENAGRRSCARRRRRRLGSCLGMNVVLLNGVR